MQELLNKVNRGCIVTGEFLSLSFSKHKNESLLMQCFYTCSDIVNVGIETFYSFYSKKDILLKRKAGVSYYEIPLHFKDKEYSYILPYKPHIPKIIYAYDGNYDVEGNWIRGKDITKKMHKYAGPTENFFNNSFTPEDIGLCDIEIIKLDKDTLQEVSILFKKNEKIII